VHNYRRVDDLDDAVRIARSAFTIRPVALDAVRSWLDEETQHGRELHGVDDGTDLAAIYLLYDFQMRLRSSVIPMGGIGLLCSRLDQRGSGAVRHMILKSLETMRDRGFAVSVLDPFDVGFYRKYGWELFSREQRTKLTAGTLAPACEAAQGIRIEDLASIDDPSLAFYNDFAARSYTLTQRDKRRWERVFTIRPWDPKTAVRGILRATADDRVVGLAVYDLNSEGGYESSMSVDLSICEGHAARSALLGALRRLSHQIGSFTLTLPLDVDLWPHLVDRPRETAVHDMFMLRIVSLEQLDGLRVAAPDLETGIEVVDAQAPWNQGTWTLTVEGGRLSVRRGRRADLRCSINGLSAVLSGFSDFREMVQTGNAEALTDGWSDLPRVTSYMADHF